MVIEEGGLVSKNEFMFPVPLVLTLSLPAQSMRQGLTRGILSVLADFSLSKRLYAGARLPDGGGERTKIVLVRGWLRIHGRPQEGAAFTREFFSYPWIPRLRMAAGQRTKRFHS